MHFLFSCDIGIRHLAYALVQCHRHNGATVARDDANATAAIELVAWDLIDLDTDDVWRAVERILPELDARLSEYATCLTHAVLEVQMAPKMKSMYHALQMYFLCRLPHVTLVPFSAAHKLTVRHALLDGERELTEAEIRVWARVLKRKSAYGLRKDLSVLHALHLVSTLPHGAERVVELLHWYDEDKADDVADALLQAVSFLERDTRRRAARQRRTQATEPKPGRIYPSKKSTRTNKNRRGGK